MSRQFYTFLRGLGKSSISCCVLMSIEMLVFFANVNSFLVLVSDIKRLILNGEQQNRSKVLPFGNTLC